MNCVDVDVLLENRSPSNSTDNDMSFDEDILMDYKHVAAVAEVKLESQTPNVADPEPHTSNYDSENETYRGFGNNNNISAVGLQVVPPNEVFLPDNERQDEHDYTHSPVRDGGGITVNINYYDKLLKEKERNRLKAKRIRMQKKKEFEDLKQEVNHLKKILALVDAVNICKNLIVENNLGGEENYTTWSVTFHGVAVEEVKLASSRGSTAL